MMENDEKKFRGEVPCGSESTLRVKAEQAPLEPRPAPAEPLLAEQALLEAWPAEPLLAAQELAWQAPSAQLGIHFLKFP